MSVVVPLLRNPITANMAFVHTKDRIFLRPSFVHLCGRHRPMALSKVAAAALDRRARRHGAQHWLAAAARLWNGAHVAARASGPAPTPDLTLFEYEASPFCRRVRETLCILGLRTLILPCPRETLRREGAYGTGSQHKDKVRDLSSDVKLLFPVLHDRTAGVALNQSAVICEHLWSNYGHGVDRPRVDALLNGRQLPRPLDFALLAAPSSLRPWPSAGLMAAAPSPGAEALSLTPLIVHGCEPDPGCRLLRERLCELQLPYVHVPTSIDAPLPHLEDPTSGFRCFGAHHALEYLETRYRGAPCLSLGAPVPEPNFGDGDRKSWLTYALAALPSEL